MQRASDLINRQVLDLEHGKIVGRVKDLIFSLRSGALYGIFVKLPFHKRQLGFVRSNQIRSIGKDAITILSSDCIGEEQRPQGILDKHLLTQSGEFLGRITDVIFSERECLIVGLEISRSVFDDLKSGRKLWPLSPETTIGDVVLVPDNSRALSADKLLEQALRLAPLALMDESSWVSFAN